MTYEQHTTESRLFAVKITNDTISSAVWSVTPTGPTITAKTQTADTTMAMLSGVVLNTKYRVTVIVTTATSQVIERSCIVRGI